MQTPIDAVMDGMGFDEMGLWHNGSFIDFWHWAFSDLGDETVKTVAAELITRMLLGDGPAAMTAQELQILRSSSQLAVRTWPSAEARHGFDA